MGNRFVVIMAGGLGERFWPQSRQKCPKHLLPIVGTLPMLAQTIARVGAVVPADHVLVITRRDQVAGVLRACPMLQPAQVIGEPEGRDTAAAVALAAVLIRQKNPKAAMALLPSDAIIHNKEGFQKILLAAFAAAEAAPNLVTIGIKPTTAATGYGYIHLGMPTAPIDGRAVFSVRRFVEKPDRATALDYVASGEYLWNAGMFIWTVATIQQAFQQYEPAVWEAVSVVGGCLNSGKTWDAAMTTEYPKIKKISVDYAVLEKAKNIVCLPANFDWDDVGEWPAIARHEQMDAQGNVLRGDTVTMQTKGSMLIGEKGHLIATLGIEDLIVVQTKDATLICPKNRAQEIKHLVKQISVDGKFDKYL